MLLRVSDQHASAGQIWGFEAEIDRGCDPEAPQMECEHAFPLLSRMIYSRQESAFLRAGVCRHEGGRGTA